MPDDLPPVHMDVNNTGDAVVIVGETEVSTAQDLNRLLPGLATPELVEGYAELLNHLEKGFDYSVILSPEEFRDDYMTQFEAEDPDEPIGGGEIRLRSYGVPNFSEITPPSVQDGNVVFFVVRNGMGIPYKVTVSDDGQSTYEPMEFSDP